MNGKIIPKDALDEREFEIINIIGAELDSSQRDLSRHLDLSLGATNMLIRRLIAKGYIRSQQLNQRKVKYMLTPKGFAEKLRKSVRYTWKTINSIGAIKNRVKEVILDLHKKGNRKFYIFGESDFALLVEMVFKEIGLADSRVSFIKEPASASDGILLICTEHVDEKVLQMKNHVDLVKELVYDHNFVMYSSH